MILTKVFWEFGTFYLKQPVAANEPTPSASQPINGGTLLWVAYTLIAHRNLWALPLRWRGILAGLSECYREIPFPWRGAP